VHGRARRSGAGSFQIGFITKAGGRSVKERSRGNERRKPRI